MSLEAVAAIEIDTTCFVVWPRVIVSWPPPPAFLAAISAAAGKAHLTSIDPVIVLREVPAQRDGRSGARLQLLAKPLAPVESIYPICFPAEV